MKKAIKQTNISFCEMLHIKFKGLVRTEDSPAFHAYGFDVHQHWELFIAL